MKRRLRIYRTGRRYRVGRLRSAWIALTAKVPYA